MNEFKALSGTDCGSGEKCRYNVSFIPCTLISEGFSPVNQLYENGDQRNAYYSGTFIRR